MEAEKKDQKSVEVEEKQMEVDRLLRGQRRLYSFSDDDRANTSDPEIMKHNIRVPITYVVQNGSTIQLASRPDPYDEFVVSPEYFVATLPGSAKYIEAIKARFAKMAKPLPANFRRTTLFQVGIRKVLKSTDELQKYLKKNERRRMNKERRQERNKASGMGEKLGREAAQVKSDSSQ